jgi:hypothetical protein
VRVNILRKLYGPITERGVWGIPTNQELKELYTTPDLVADIKRRMRHVIRVVPTRVTHLCKARRKARKARRPTLRWTEDGENDLRDLK